MRGLRISAKLNLGFGGVIALFLLLAAFTAWRVDQVSKAVAQMNLSSQLLQLAGAWQGDVRQNSARSLAVGLSQTGEMLDFFKEVMAATSRSTTETQKAFFDKVQNPDSRKRAEAVVEVRKQWLAARDRVNALKAAGDGDGARALVMGEFTNVTNAYIKATQDLVDGEVKLVEAAEKDINAQFRMLYLAGGAMLLLVAGIAVVVSQAVSRGIARGVAEASEAAQRIGKGDLSQPVQVHGEDEIGELLQGLSDMQNALSEVVSRVRAGADFVATASAEIANGNQELSGRTESQASALEETAASTEELSSTVRQNAENAQLANSLALSASSIAEEGGKVVGDVVTTMRGISESSQKIHDIINVIDAIAFQTNILALNAAVEAARAGEQGRGFAVVASEVRNLAGRSAQAAKEIKDLITESVDRVRHGSTLVDQAGTTMQEVVSSIARVNTIVGEISTASGEQSHGVSQVGEAVVSMEQGTQENAALVEEMAAAATNLRQQAAELVAAVAVFQLGAQSGSQARGGRAPALLR